MNFIDRANLLNSTDFYNRCKIAICDWINYWVNAGTDSIENEILRDQTSTFCKFALANLDHYVNKITAIPREIEIDGQKVSVAVALDIYASENDILGNLEESVYSALEKLDAMNLKIAVGAEVKYSDYKATIDSFVLNAQGYLDQYYLTTNIALKILDSDSNDGLSSTLASFYATNSDKLADLGGKLKKAVSGAFVDGEWIPNKLQEAIELQQEIQEILDYVSDVEYRAEMQNLKLSVSGDLLTPESFKEVLNGAKEAIEGRLASLKEVKMSQLQVAVMQYDANIDAGMSEAEAKKIYDMTVADIEEAYKNGVVEVTFGTVDFGLETLKSTFATELEKAESEGWFNYELQLDRVFSLATGDQYKGENGTYAFVNVLQRELEANFKLDTSKISKEARKNLEEILKELKPTMADYEELASANRKAGETVTQNVRNGLNDYNELKALSGDVDAINYLIGKGFSTDSTFLNTLATVSGAGKQIDKSVAEGLLNNIDYVKDEASGLVVGIKDSVTGKTIELTPTLKQNMEDLGVDLSDGLLKGAETEMKSQEKSWKDWAIWPWNWFKKENEINSPSKLFERGGGYLTEGLLKGVPKNSLKDRITSAWTTAKDWWNEKKGELKKYTPSIGSIKDKVSSAWTSVKTWWNERRSNLSYTPSIGSIKDKISSAWSSAKKWWSEKKGSLSYTPSIGSIKSKLQSAWNTAKTWWSNNVKLSIPSLSFKITYTKATGWKKAVVNALGLDGWPKLSFAANGGIFDTGSLIWAGERGPEIMANAGGGKTGVMNVQQMADAVYEGVYAAVIAANRASAVSGDQAVYVYLDGKEITKSVEKRQRERGATIMGTQVYSY